MPASLSLPPRLSQAEFEALAIDPVIGDDGCFASGFLIALFLLVAAGGLIGFCVTLAGL